MCRRSERSLGQWVGQRKAQSQTHKRNNCILYCGGVPWCNSVGRNCPPIRTGECPHYIANYMNLGLAE
jgi:hypothetical protein